MVGDDAQITLNKDLACKRHKDHGNKEHSYILWLGDFTGGALNFDDGTKVEGKGVWHKISGHIHHWNDPHEGSKYSSVLYRGSKKTSRWQRPYTLAHKKFRKLLIAFAVSS